MIRKLRDLPRKAIGTKQKKCGKAKSLSKAGSIHGWDFEVEGEW